MHGQAFLAFMVHQSERITLRGFTIHHAGGMGLIAEETENVTLRRCRLVRPPGSARLVSTTADATHFNLCRGRILVEDSEFAHMLDDAINVHGVYARVDGSPAPRTIGIHLYHFQQLGVQYARPGDRLRFSLMDTLLGYGVRIENNRFRLAQPVTIRKGKAVEGLVVKNNEGLASTP